MALTDVFVRRVKYTGQPTGGKHTGSAGMYLLVKAAGKYWRFDYHFAGKRQTLTMGRSPAMPGTAGPHGNQAHQAASRPLRTA